MSTGAGDKRVAEDRDGGGKKKKKTKATTCIGTTVSGKPCKQTVDCLDCQVCDSHARRGLGQCTSCDELAQEGGGRGTGRRTTESEYSPMVTRMSGEHESGSLGEGRFEAYGTPAPCVMPVCKVCDSTPFLPGSRQSRASSQRGWHLFDSTAPNALVFCHPW